MATADLQRVLILAVILIVLNFLYLRRVELHIYSNIREQLKDFKNVKNEQVHSNFNSLLQTIDDQERKSIYERHVNRLVHITRNYLSSLKGNAFEDIHVWTQVRTLQVYKDIPCENWAINFIDNEGTALSFKGYSYNPPDIRSWEPNSKYWLRKGRFPSIEERIKYYMGEWYEVKENRRLFLHKNDWKDLPCNFLNETKSIRNRLICFPSEKIQTHSLSPLRIFRLSQKGIKPTSVYLQDLVDLSILRKDSSMTPLVAHIGDGASRTYHNALNYSFPVFNKVRIVKGEDIKQPPHLRKFHSNIIWPMNRMRHFAPVSEVPKLDRPWEDKISKLIWRGRAPERIKHLRKDTSIEFQTWKQRFELVSGSLNSHLIDARFVSKGKKNLPDQYYGRTKSMHDMLKYKYQLSIEGNDVASGLKWMLFSNSLMFMPEPTHISWAMESLLEPFVHYIPIYSNMSNIEDMVRWANDNPVKSKQIAERGTLFVYDTLFHPDAYSDEEQILKGIYERYERIFRVP